MFSRSVIFRPGRQHDPQLAGVGRRRGAVLQHRVHLGPLARRRRPSRSSGAGFSGSVSRNVSRSRIRSGPNCLFQPLRHDRQGGRVQRPRRRSVARGTPCPWWSPITNSSPSVRGTPISTSAVLQLDEVREIIGMDRGAWKADVAQHRFVIAVDQIREVRPDLAAAPMHLMALRALGLFAEEHVAAARPVAAFQLGNVAGGVQRGVGGPRQGGPRQEQPVQRQRPRPVVLVGGIRRRPGLHCRRRRSLISSGIGSPFFGSQLNAYRVSDCLCHDPVGFDDCSGRRRYLQGVPVEVGTVNVTSSSGQRVIERRSRLHGRPQHLPQVELGPQRQRARLLEQFPQTVVIGAAGGEGAATADPDGAASRPRRRRRTSRARTPRRRTNRIRDQRRRILRQFTGDRVWPAGPSRPASGRRRRLPAWRPWSG